MLVEQPKLAITKRHNVRMRDCGSPAAKIVKRAKQQHDHKAVHYDMEVWVKHNRGSLCVCVWRSWFCSLLQPGVPRRQSNRTAQ
jgi:hypothetical protein